MKKILSITLQFLLFFLTFAIGSFAHPFHLSWDLAAATSPSVHRSFVLDGLLLALALFIVIVIIQAIRKRLCNTQWTALAFFRAVAAGYAIKLGFITREV